MQLTAKVGGIKEKTHRQQRQRTWLWDESSIHHIQVFARYCSKKIPEVKRNNGAASKTFGWQLGPRKTARASPVCSVCKTGMLLWE